MGPASKINRDPRFLRELIEQGKRQAGEFLTALAFESRWRARDAEGLVTFLAEDCELTSGPPFPAEQRLRGDSARNVVRDLLAQDARVDLTRKQLAHEQVRWTVRPKGGTAEELGQVVAEFRDGKVVRLSLGAAAEEGS